MGGSTFVAVAPNVINNITVNAATIRTGVNARITSADVFNNDVTFIGCTILMDPGATITINSNPKLSTFALNSIRQHGSRHRGATICGGREYLNFGNGYSAGASRIVNTDFSGNSVAITANKVGNLDFATFSGNHFKGIKLGNLLLSHTAKWEGQDTLTTSAAWQQSKQNLLGLLTTNRTQLNTLVASINSQHLSGYETARNYIANLPTSNAWETNWKTLLLLAVKYPLSETVSDADSTSLRAIAYSCPAANGTAVMYARLMLPVREQLNIPHEQETDPYCRERSEPLTIPGPTAYLWPNPATERLFVGFDLLFSGTLEIIRLNGDVVTSLKVEEMEVYEVNVSRLANGFYLLRTIDRNQQSSQYKLVIAR